MSRKPCCVGEGLKKGAWTAEEDNKLISYLEEHGEGGWRDIPQKAGLKRCGKSCRLRWVNYLKPENKRGEFSSEEEQIIILLHASLGNKWSVIASHLPRRTDNEIKNYWNTRLKKRLLEQGIDPVTHKPLASNSSPSVTTPLENLPSLDASSSDKQYSQSSSMPSLDASSSDKQYSQLSSMPSLDASSSDKQYSHSSSMPSLSRLPSGFNTVSGVSQFTNNNDETPIQDCSLSCKKPYQKQSSTSSLLNKVAGKATSIKDILSASLGASLSPATIPYASFSNGYEEDSSNAILTNTLAEFDPFFQSSLCPEHEISIATSNFEDYDFLQFLEELGRDDHNDESNMNVDYGHDLLTSDIVSQEVSLTRVDEQDNMIGNFEGWSNYLLDHDEFYI